MDNCLSELIGKPSSYFTAWDMAKNFQKLYVEVISGSLRGTSGRFLGMKINSSCHRRVGISWNNFYNNPSVPNWLKFCESILIEDKKPKIRILTSESPWEVTEVSITSCSWVLSATTLKKVSKPRVKRVVDVIPDVYDSLGEKINIGDFCSYILYNHRHGGARIYYGTVTKINTKGDVFCTDVNLGDWPEGHSVPEEKKVLDPSMITIMNDSIMDRIMLARLSI